MTKGYRKMLDEYKQKYWRNIVSYCFNTEFRTLKTLNLHRSK